jgi:hypothetical protein
MSKAVVWLVFAVAIGIAGCSADDVTETQSEVGTATAEPSVSTEPTVTVSPASTASPAPLDEQETTTQTVGNASEDAAVLDPLTLTEAQLDELSPSPELVAAAMGAAEVEEDRRGFGVGVDLPSDAVVAERIYWSMDGGERTMGVQSVDFASVELVLVGDETDVAPIVDAVTSFDAVYWRWLPIELAGASEAQESEWIPYEGEPEDEPEFAWVVARRGRLIVIVTAAGSDRDAASGVTTSIAEAVFGEAAQISEQ